MFNKFIRYFNQNRIKVIGIIVAIFLAIIFIQMLNNLAKEENENQLNQIISNKISQNEHTDSVINTGGVSNEKANENERLIDNFVKCCNNKETKQAYDLLSDDCKDALFRTEEEFVNNYYNVIFNQYKVYELENWISSEKYSTYKIKFTDDALSTGGNINSNQIEDYYTVVEQGDISKLNINKYVYKEIINKIATQEELSIRVISRENYIDYQVYEINFINHNSNDIRIYDSNSKSSWNAIDDNTLKYSAFVEEIPEVYLTMRSGQEQTIKVKFSKIYNPSRIIQSLYFSNMYCMVEPRTLFNINIPLN